MAVTDPKASTAVAVRPSASGVVLEPDAGVTYNLDRFPAERFTRLIPTQTIQMPSDLMVPVIQIVQLDIDRDTYESADVPKGNRAINRVGLRKLLTAAAVSILNERRTDDGSDPDVCEISCEAEMVLPTGQRVRAPGTKRVDLRRQKWASDAQRAKYASFFQEQVASRAQNRAARAILSLQASYPIRDLQKPFAVVSYAPNMDHPEIRAAVVAAMVPAIVAGYGPEQRQLAAGPSVQTVAEAPDDEPIEGESRAAPDAGPEPDWSVFGGSETPAAAAAEPTIVAVLRTKAEKSGLAGEITDPQKQALAAKLLAPLGVDLVAAGLSRVWGIERRDGKLIVTAAQAQALIDTAASDDFVDTWREAFGSEAAA